MSFFRRKRPAPAGPASNVTVSADEPVTDTSSRPARALPLAGKHITTTGQPVVAFDPPPTSPLPGSPEPVGAAESRLATVRDALATVKDPEIGQPLTTLGMIKVLEVIDGTVRVTVELTTPACPLKGQIENEVRAAVLTVPGIDRVEVTLTARVRQGGILTGKPAMPGVKNIIAVASGKGGVGKSTVATNLAVALALDGAAVGLLDADVYGPSLPLMLALQGRQPGTKTRPPVEPTGQPARVLVPLEAYGVKVMSIGFLVDPAKPVIWRGPMASQLIQQFINDVEWGELDYLLVDLPPGTGDIQLTLTQRLPLSGAVIVTTPQDVALADAVKGLQMFREVQVPILGIIENMSFFLCPHCGERTNVFGQGGGEWAATHHDVPLLGQIPLDAAIREGGDAGTPIVAADALSPQASALRAAAQRVAGRLSVEAHLTGGKRASGPLITIQRRQRE